MTESLRAADHQIYQASTREPATDITHYRMLIGGQWVDGQSGTRIAVEDPYSRKVWADVPRANDQDVDAAVRAARTAFDSAEWSRATARDRARLLRKLADLLERDEERLARVQVQENGKALRETLGQARLLPAHFEYYAGLAEASIGNTNPISSPGLASFTVREPIGVVAALTPWNSPLLLMAWKVGPALAAGNTVVVKPSEITPVSTLLFAELVQEAGFPSGVFNVVTGYGVDTGSSLVNHTEVDRIAFTGATATGKAIASSAGARLARVSLELGGKSANIVFADADLEAARSGVVAGIFGAGGQTCMAGSRILVEASVYDDFVDSLVAMTQKIKLGNPMHLETEMGPMAHEEHMKKVLGYIASATGEGAALLTGGGQPKGMADGSLFVEPTLFAQVHPAMRVVKEEVFGPVGCVMKFEGEEEAARVANDTAFGLAAGVWTQNLGRAHRMARRLRAGTVWLNTYRKTNYVAPFGGFKDSGIGRENGIDALNDYTEVKSVTLDLGGGIADPFNPRA